MVYLSNLYECVQNHTSSRNDQTKTGFEKDILKWRIILDAVGLGFRKNDDVPSGCIYYDEDEKAYKIKKTSESGDAWLTLKHISSDDRDTAIVRALTYNQGIFETWDQQSCLIKPLHDLGYNTGGNYNFVKLTALSKHL